MRQNRWLCRLLSIGVLWLSIGSAAAQNDHWVTSWTTAQQLVGANAAAGGGPARGGRGGGPVTNLPAAFSDETLRQVAHVSLGGSRIGWNCPT